MLATHQSSADDLELTILMPCLNEAETLATCIDKARRYLDTSGIRGEILVADNGSSRTPALFNFDGFLRTGVGDPRQVQLSVKLVF